MQVKVRTNIMFSSFDFDLDPMTLICKLDLDMINMYLNRKMFLAFAVQKL